MASLASSRQSLMVSTAVVAIVSITIGSIWLARRKKRKALTGALFSQLEMKCTISPISGMTSPVSMNHSFFSMMTELDLSNCGLFELPEEISSLSALRKLNAAKNPCSSLPASFIELQELRVAFFLGCEFETVPTVLGELRNLFMLSFKANKLVEIPESSLSPSIGWLILSDNKIQKLPESIGRLSKLRKLMLAGNQLSELPSSFASCKALELVRLSDNKLEQFPKVLFSLPKLAWIALAGNVFNKDQLLKRQVAEVCGEVKIDKKSLLGSGASGEVFKGTLTTSDSKVTTVAVKLFRAGKTSDGNPVDEMAVGAVAGSTSSPHLMKSYGKLPILDQTLISDGMDLGLVLEFLEGYEAIAQPPSFQTVTRDTYKDMGDKTLFSSFAAILGILLDVCSAATTLHELGIVHGDLYGHNILYKKHDDASQEGGLCVLSDFGASFFYKVSASSKDSKALTQEESELLEKVEVLAFGHLVQELTDRVNVPDSLLTSIKSLKASCTASCITARPFFSQILASLTQFKSLC